MNTDNVNNNLDGGNGKEIIVMQETGLMTVDSVEQQFKLVHDLYSRIMKKDEHYGIIPGTKKDTLFKAGAEKLDLLFKLVPKIDEKIVRELSGGHREIEMTIGLYHKQTCELWGQGVGSCSTMESKFRYREGKRVCPQCGKETIIKGKKEYGGGWLCYAKSGGCGAKFLDGDQSIEGQQVGKIENSDIADVYNTVLKMAYKRALVSATITATGVSDIFTQDAEDFADQPEKKQPAKKASPEDAVKKEFSKPTKEEAQAKLDSLPDKVKDAFKSLGYDPGKQWTICTRNNWDADKILAELNDLAISDGNIPL